MLSLLLTITSLLLIASANTNCGIGDKPSTCKEFDDIKCYASGKVLEKCADGTVPTYSGCCPSCFPNLCSNCPAYKTLPACSSLPTINADGCPSCQIKIKDCNIEQLPTCTNTGMNFDKTTLCPTCKFACQWDKLETCAAGVQPDWTNLCPSCNPVSECLQKCVKSLDSIRSCAGGELPEYDGECCVTCVLRLPSQCTANALTTCKTTYANLPTCTGTTSMTKDFENCCVSGCKCPLDFTTRKSCTAQEVADCISKAPTCKTNEVPCLNSDSCCLSCNTGGVWAHRVETVAKCLASLRACAPDEKPVDVAGQPCKSCTVYPDFTKCDICTKDDEICVYEWDFDRDAPKVSPKCVSKKSIAIAFKGVDEAAKKAVQYYIDNFKTDVKSAYYYLQTLFDKACSLPQYFGTCRNILANLRNIRVNKVVIDADLTINIDIDVAEDSFQTTIDVEAETEVKAKSKRATLQTSTSQFINEATSNTQVNDVSATTTENGNYGSSVIASFVLIALCLLTLF